jgi:hypothetical protein
MPRGENWSEFEVEAIVADYLAMLKDELRGVSFNKAAHNRALMPLLNARTSQAVEMKHQNISAILIEIGHPYIRGYKPASQYQGLLSDVVLDRIDEDLELAALVARFVDANVSVPRAAALKLTSAPTPLLDAARIALADQLRRRQARRIDYLRREAENRSVGFGGESMVVEHERRRLSSLGCDTLASRVEHVSSTKGDGLGYDVLSFQRDGGEFFIEVKTTQLGPLTPFYISDNELTFSSEERERYSLYRVYDFRTSPAMFILPGAVAETCSVRPAQFLAAPR